MGINTSKVYLSWYLNEKNIILQQFIDGKTVQEYLDCAVSNSDLSLKQIATKIILSNDEDGVANYILNNYLNM